MVLILSLIHVYSAKKYFVDIFYYEWLFWKVIKCTNILLLLKFNKKCE